ncbi:MAG: protein kinase [Candidatus Nealsonbacteria bacterium]|nr:protein kinase [Candidatus Nealsonbacteria bacterium]
MPQTFDPYHTWLGIPPEKQPPHCYDLLGVPLFEDKPEVIEAAADRQMGHLRTYQTGKHSKLSQKLLNEVAAARVCLLNPQKKADYDQQLRKILQKARQAGGERAGGETTTQATDFNRLGDYQLLEKLGEGGMGAVYKALHTKLGREVAIKVLPPGKLSDKSAIARFEREMMAVGRLDHANIVRAHDAREIDGKHFLVMELVNGMDLKELGLRRQQLPVADACELIRQTALGLQCAHENKLVHRDIKPSNLMLTADGRVKVLDLGLARIQSEQAGEQLTATEQAMGTLDYMAPEQAVDTHSVDIRADIYSLGCTLFQLLCGRAPFEDVKHQTAFEKMNAHVKTPPPSIRKLRDDVPKELIAVVNRMLAKDPARRFATPAEVADVVGPMAAAADLSALYAAAKRTPPVTRPNQAQIGTPEPQHSSRLTRFLQRVKVTPPPPPPGAPQPAGSKLPLILGGVVVGLLLLVGLVVAGLMLSGNSKEQAELAFNWPADDRQDATLKIDGKRLDFPAGSGTVTHSSAPGSHRIVAERPGYQPHTETITVAAGQRKEAARPRWVRQSRLALNWPADQRKGAVLEIDGTTQNLDTAGFLVTNDRLWIPLTPGKHIVQISRPGLKPYRHDVTIESEQDRLITPKWQPTDALPVARPTDKFPVPSDETQQGYAEQIESFYGITDAKTPEEKAAVARKMLDRASQVGDKPVEQYVLLTNAVQLATAGCDKPIVQQATDLLGKQFDVDATELQQTALATIDRAVEAQSQAAQADAAAQAEADRQREAATQAVEARRTREERYTKAVASSEALVVIWDFRGASAALAKLDFTDDEELTVRLARRRDEVARMGALKERMIAKINAASPPMKKSDLMLRGINGELSKADATGITAKLGSGKTELLAWKDLNEKARPKLLQLVVNPTSADDWLSASLLALSSNDTVLAEKLFPKARSMGTDIGPYLAPLAQAAFSQVEELMNQKQFTEANTTLTNLEEKYATIPWFAEHKPSFAAARARANSGIFEAEAETLYEAAVALLKQEQLFDVKPLVEKLKTNYAASVAVTDTDRSPSFANLEQAVADLGKMLTVRQDGKGDHKSIQAAIDAAQPNSLIEIQDSGPYNEKVAIQKEGLILRAKKGVWPIITSIGPTTNFPTLMSVRASQVTIERLILAHGAPAGDHPGCLTVGPGPLSVRSCIVFAKGAHAFGNHADCHIENSIIVGSGAVQAPLTVKDSLWFGGSNYNWAKSNYENVLISGKLSAGSQCKARFCTMGEPLNLSGTEDTALVDCILPAVQAAKPGARIVNCNVYGKPPAFIDQAKPGEGCFGGNPQFANPKKLDYRLMPTSPCRGKASDGGDLGVRYTPEMIEMLKRALQLSEQGIIKF